jgi:Tol biopolymer transport system component
LLREIIAMGVKARDGRGRDLTRRMPYLPALIVAAVLMACALVVATLQAVSRESDATFPGKNGRIAYESNGVIYTINPDGSAKDKVTNTGTAGYSIDYSPNGKRIAYTGFDGRDAEIYTINVSGGSEARTNVTNNATHDYWPSYSPNGKKIVCVRGGEFNSKIYTISVGGGGRSKVTDAKGLDSNPSWGSRP